MQLQTATTPSLKTIALIVLFVAAGARAQTTYYWDANGAGPGIGGTGTWDTTGNTWRVASPSGTLGTYGNSSGDQAVFDTSTNSGRTVTLNSSNLDINVNKISFQYTGWPSPETGHAIVAPISGTAKLVLGGTTPTIQVQNWPVKATISAPIAGNSSLTVITGSHNVSTLTLSGTNTFSGPVLIPDGTLRISSLNYVSSGNWSGHLSGSSLGLPTTVAEGTIHLGNGTTSGTLYRTGTAPETTDRVIDLAGTTGGARIDNSGANHSLKFSRDFTASGAGDKTLTLYTTSGAIEIAGAIVDSAGGTTTVAAAGTTAITLSGASTYSGPTFTTNGGGLRVNSIRNLGEASAMGAPTTVENGTIKLGDGASTKMLTYFGTGNTTDRVIDLSGTTGGATISMDGSSGTLRFTSDFTATGSGAKTLSVSRYNGNGTLEIAGKIVDSASGATSLSVVDWTSSALHVFSGDSSFTGKTTFGAGARVSVNSIRNLGMTSAVGAPTTVVDGTISLGSGGFSSALIYTGTGDTTNRTINLASTTGAITFTQSGTSLLTFTSDFTATGAGSKTLTLNGSTSGIGAIAGAIVDNSATNKTSLTKAGSGIWILSGANTYTGATQVNGGILTFANPAAKSPGTAVNVAAAGSLGLGVGGAGSFSSSDVDALFANTLSGVAMAAASGVALDTSAGDFTYATHQGTARALTKLGANTLTLTGNNTYTGGTRVATGTLLVNNASGSGTGGGAVTVNAGTLGGTGRIAPSGSAGITVNSGATIAPGASIGTLTFNLGSTTGGVTMDSGAKFVFEVAEDGSDADRIAFWNYASAADFVRHSNVIDLEVLGDPIPGFRQYTVTLFSFYEDGGLTLVDAGIVSGLTLGALDPRIYSAALVFNGTTIDLTYSVPEPASIALLALAGLATLRRRQQ